MEFTSLSGCYVAKGVQKTNESLLADVWVVTVYKQRPGFQLLYNSGENLIPLLLSAIPWK